MHVRIPCRRPLRLGFVVVESVVRLGESWPRDGALLERFAGRLCAKGKRARYQRERRDYGSRTLRPTPKRQQALLTNDRLDIGLLIAEHFNLPG